MVWTGLLLVGAACWAITGGMLALLAMADAALRAEALGAGQQAVSRAALIGWVLAWPVMLLRDARFDAPLDDVPSDRTDGGE